MDGTISFAIPGLFGPLTPLEARLIDLATISPQAREDAGRAGAAKTDLERTDQPADHRHLQAAVLRHVVLDPLTVSRLGPSGLALANVTVEGNLDLAFASIPFPLSFRGCVVNGTVNLQHATAVHLKFSGGRVQHLDASGVRLRGDLVLEDGIEITTGVDLRNARVGGDVRLFGARLGNGAVCALEADGCRIQGSITTRRGDVPGGSATPAVQTHGCVSLCGAEVRGSIELQGATLTAGRGPDGHTHALVADRLVVRGTMHLSEGFRAYGSVKMVGCRIRNSLVCSGGRFTCLDDAALSLDNARIGQALFLNNGYRAKGKTRLVGAHIGSDLDCSKGRFLLARGEYALSAARVHVDGDVQMIGTHANEELRFRGARFRAKCIAKNVFVRFPPRPATRPTAVCLNLEGAHVAADVEVTGGSFDGILELSGAEIGSDVEVRGLRLAGGAVNGVHARSATIAGRLVWRAVRPTGETEMVLDHASIGRISHAQDSWPEPRRLCLAGCTYAAIEFPEPAGGTVRTGQLPNGFTFQVESRRTPADWVKLASSESYEPQPFEQLERVLLRSGHEDAAKEVGIAKHEARVRTAPLPPRDRFLARLFGAALRHGYDARPLVYAAAVVLALGAVVFGVGHERGLMAPTSPEVFLDSAYQEDGTLPPDYPAFNLFAYSVDTFLPPVIDFHQETHWLPNPRNGPGDGPELRTPVGTFSAGAALRGYLWLHIGAGWLVTSLLLVNLTGLIRNR